MARPNKATATLESMADCTDVMRRLLLVTTDLEKQQATRDAAMAGVSKSYEKAISGLIEQQGDLELQLQQYYMSHLAEVEHGGKKSIELTYGTMGRRLGSKALKLLNKSWTWPAALVALANKFGNKYLRLRDPEIDKDAVKAGIPEDELAVYGLKLEQGEDFFIDLKRPKEDA